MPKVILCATDGSEHSGVATAFAVQLAKNSAASLVFVTVNVAIGGPRGPLGYQRDEGQIKSILDDAVRIAKQAGVSECKTIWIKSRDAAYAIVQQAEQLEADHIVVGTGDRPVVSRLMLGSVSREVAAKAHCSVTIAR
jgi:nucleotide-binding universal stress UspA family protein